MKALTVHGDAKLTEDKLGGKHLGILNVGAKLSRLQSIREISGSQCWHSHLVMGKETNIQTLMFT